MYGDDIKLLAKNEKQLEILMQTGRILDKDIGMQQTYNENWEKRKIKVIELPNQERIRAVEDRLIFCFNGISTLFRLFNAEVILLEEQ